MIRILFRRLAIGTADLVGSPWAFLVSAALILAWATSGPYYHYSDDWQLVMNTFTSVVTFLMVFLIQAMQNRDSKAMHLKLDELLRAVQSARTSLVSLEQMSDDELAALADEFQRLRARHHPAKTPQAEAQS
jgi:low affinity Fe/Cu permease